MAAIMTSFIETSSIMTSSILPSPRWQIYKTFDKNTSDFVGLIFQKPLTCITCNNIILHVYHNLKCNENW